MECKVVHVETNSEEWDDLRACRITASRFGDVCAKPDSARYTTYRRHITLELLGHRHVDEEEPWFQHGREMEPRGLSRAEYKYGWDIDHDTFLIHPKYDFIGASPDGLIRTGGQYAEGMEMKSRKLYKNYRDAILRAKKGDDMGDRRQCVDPSHRWQVQGCMWLTGWDYWWYVNYYEDKDGTHKLGRVAIPRDQALIDKIEEWCLIFMKECYDNASLAG